MASSLDRLEKFFSSSKRRDKVSQQKHASAQNPVPVQRTTNRRSEARDSLAFPSPSFLKPTSSRMQPRDAQYQPREEGQLVKDKARSRSLPDVKKSLRRQKAAYNSLDVERKTRSYESSQPPSIIDCPSTPQSPTFQFPEDSLFRSIDTPITPTTESPRYASRLDTTFDTPKQDSQNPQLLDWAPRHMSMLFNPNELMSMNEQLGLGLTDELQETMILMPSPMFMMPERPPPKSPLRGKRPTNPPSPPHRDSQDNRGPKFATFSNGHSMISTSDYQAFSPPASDSEGEHPTMTPAGSLRNSRVSIRSVNGAAPSFKSRIDAEQSVDGCERQTVRDTWGFRREDPKLACPHLLEVPMSQSRLRKAHSASTLATITAKNTQEYVFQEPTINDVYALSDEDIFETRPLTPAPGPPPAMPPTPPPKDDVHVRNRRRTQAQSSVVQPKRVHTASVSTINTMSPPATPSHQQMFMPRPASLSTLRVGAIMAADIAKKYNFDLLYLVSLENKISSTVCPPQDGSSRRSSNSKSIEYLAAFGLQQAGETFQPQDEVLLGALRTKGWTELETPVGAFQHGWACSFDNNRLSLAARHAGSMVHDAKAGRTHGVVFAAHTREPHHSVIPKESPHREQLLAALHTDIESLVDTIIGKPSLPPK